MKVEPIEIKWHAGLSIYASEPFLKTVGDEYGWLGGFDEVGKLRCILPYTVLHKPFFRLVRFRVETISVECDVSVADEKSFLESVVAHFRASGVDMIIPATTNTIFRTFPDGAVAAPYGSYLIDLTQPEETLWGNVTSSHRRKVRLARKAGIVIQEGPEHIKAAYDLVRDTFKRSKLGFMNYPSFDRQLRSLGENIKIFIASYEGAIQATIVVPFSRKTAYYLYGGSVPQPMSGATNLLHWHAIELFRNLGVRTYDFVGVRTQPPKGSKQDGLKMFKERFGGELVKGYMWKYSLHPLKYFIYTIAVRVNRKGDIVDQERQLLRQQKAGEQTEIAPSGATLGTKVKS